ncbi:glycosyltransferase family 2 protein [Halomonas sp. ATCH28]|uniref:Glycosyltransferase family 2 protein n=1 Tax=Halomonas gemina TaxID=2945105 RepID=A0ABT0SXA4_9GAMM|nr:glycosyltransferase family 2 protein [Halomonas gemina]MCL7939243.1 glycosyltransferase family 2 protein [Halomonas gemina]
MSSWCKNTLVEILLATSNGERYLVDLLESLLAQTHRPIRVLVHDDGSDDSTVSILKKYSDFYPDVFFVIQDENVRLGVLKNFEFLMNYSSADYIMFCDQDDVWMPEKIQEMLKTIKETELNFPQKPILIHCDLEVVDNSLGCISPSFFSYQRLPRHATLPRQLIQNNVTGCAAILNRRAIELSLPMADAAVMHDWWISCCILRNDGIVQFLPEPLVKYRQHSQNAIGAKGYSLKSYTKKIMDAKKWWADYKCILAQAAELGHNSYMALSWLTILKIFYFFKRN